MDRRKIPGIRRKELPQGFPKTGKLWRDYQERMARDFSSSRGLESADVLCVPQAFQTDGSAENTRHPPQEAPSGFPKNREALAGLSRADGERFFVESRFGKRRCTLCTSSFPGRWIGGKYPASAARSSLRVSQKQGSSGGIIKSGWREIFRRVEVWKAQMYFVYLKLSRLMDRRKIPGIRRRGSRQSFPKRKGRI